MLISTDPTEATKAAPLSQGTVVPFAISPDTLGIGDDSDKLVYALLRKFGYLLGVLLVCSTRAFVADHVFVSQSVSRLLPNYTLSVQC